MSTVSKPRDQRSPLPVHLAIIMDGNGRWAQERGLSRGEGHKAGVRAVRSIVAECRTIGIRYLTLYAFSRENWGRPQAEVSLLFELLVHFLNDELEEMVRNGIRLQIFGELGRLPLPARTAVRHAMSRTKNGSSMTVNLALNYSGRDEILRAARSLIHDRLEPDAVTEASFRARLYSADQPDPDLLIRTSGEQRLSNYLLFQSAYSELYFTPVYWPDFGPDALHQALEEYGRRTRRFGLTTEQIRDEEHP